ncbi:hypothetical protein PAHAL_5G458700 [Panicum hallii]|uniref:Glycosyltransferase 61 catalytic domain-containing protein n=1 Tax=Panicum hallii TaxID=206008 RepID=A0A2S3HXG9_9POAL|nr:uncharacterized protein LOC112893688 [Panicum hallii]PAN32043.1 hypothetical protein PAHAL_5G458700 [Panicum hallii]
MEGGGKVAYSYGGGGHHHDTKLLKSFSSVEKFGLGLFAGLLIVACAYFSTAKFDAVHIAMSKQPISSSAKNAVGFSSPVNAGDSSKQPLDLGEQEQGALSKEGSKDAGGGISNSGVAVASAAPPDPGAEGSNDEAPEKDDDPSAVAVLPPLSSDSADTTQESGVLEDQELQVQNAVAEAANPPENNDGASSSTNGSSSSVIPFPSDPAEIPAPAPAPAIEAPADQIPEIEALPPSTPEIEASPVQLIPPTPEVKQDWEAPAREWKPLCDVTSNHRIDWCELDGDVRVLGANASVTLVAPPGADGRTFREESWRVKPYPRKADPNAMRNVRVVTVRSVPAAGAPACTDRHDVPALVFSDRGYTGNYFHAYTDVVLPLFLTARQYGGEVLLLVTDLQAWWVGKYAPVFRSLSNYEPVDLGRDPRVHCFRRVQVGLTSHDDFSIDPRRAPNGYSMLDFTAFLRAAYGLPRDAVPVAPQPGQGQGRRPRLLVIARARNRRFLNVEEIARGARRVGFEVVVSEGGHEVAPFAELANSCDAVVGVHGAGLTNMVFLPRGAVVIQVIPLGPLEFVASYFRGPSRDMGLRYLEYRVAPEESTLVDRYPRDHPVIADPGSIKAKDWASFMGVYLFEQDVRLDMKRFRPVLKKALSRLRAKPKNN